MKCSLFVHEVQLITPKWNGCTYIRNTHPCQSLKDSVRRHLKSGMHNLAADKEREESNVHRGV